MTIRYDEKVSEDFEMLNTLLDDYYYERFGEVALKYRPYNTLQGIEDFFIACDEEKPIGCGCFRKITDAVAELKRVFVLPDYRRQGIAKVLVKNCEEIAKRKNSICMRLETGVEMIEAIELYKKMNYSIIENYDNFAGDEICCCMEKTL